MSQILLPYGKSTLTINLPVEQVDLILPAASPAAVDPVGKVRGTLSKPLGGVDITRFRGARSVAIGINDKTRPVPLDYLLPPLLEKLAALKIQDSSITFLIETGTHKPLSQAEIKSIVPPDIYTKYRFVSHDCDDLANLTYLGTTHIGTPVWINSIFMSAELRIVIGDIEPHHFMGFSGGAKGAAIGLAGRETINANHSMLADPCANIAIYAENPMRQDVEEIGEMIGIDLVLNAVLNHEKEIVEVFAGRPHEVMQAGIPCSLGVCATTNRNKYDIVVASAGGYPKDINLYQSQKAITHASLFCKKGGTIILAAECIEGSGSESFEAFITGLHSFDQVLERFNKTPFQIGPHKAFLLARQSSNYSVFLFSSIPADKVRSYLLYPIEDIGSLVGELVKTTPVHPRIAVLPYATTTLPWLG